MNAHDYMSQVSTARNEASFSNEQHEIGNLEACPTIIDRSPLAWGRLPVTTVRRK